MLELFTGQGENPFPRHTPSYKWIGFQAQVLANGLEFCTSKLAIHLQKVFYYQIIPNSLEFG